MAIKIQHIAAQSKPEKSQEVHWLNKEIHVFGKSFSNKSKEQFYAEMFVLLSSGVDLKQSLDLIADMQKKKKDKELIGRLSDRILDGSSLSVAMEAQNVFSSYESQAIKIGEQTGQLKKITESLRDYFQKKIELKRQLVSSLSYPIIVLITAMLVVFFMLSYVVPMFVDIFKQNRVELPWLTEQIVALSGLLKNHGLVLLLIVLGVVIGGKYLAKKQWYYKLNGRFQLRLPVFGNYIRKIYLIQFTQAMALLTQSRIPVVIGIAMVRKMIRFYPLESSLNVIESKLVLGDKLHESFGAHTFYPKKMVALLKVAEETNQTEYIFQKLYDQYSEELKYQGGIISNVLNFLLTLFVGLIVGVILVAMYLPMFKLSSVIG